jgi:hypothetical protein
LDLIGHTDGLGQAALRGVAGLLLDLEQRGVTEVPTRRRSRLSPDPIETVRRTWRARYRDETGKEHARHFDRKADAARWLAEVTAAVVTGQYVDPEAGRITLERSFRDWSRRQVWVTGTRDAMGLAVKSCTFANVELRD